MTGKYFLDTNFLVYCFSKDEPEKRQKCLDHIQEAIDLHILHQISFGDSLIISGAKSARCPVILTEDMGNGAEIAGVRIQNPFLE